MDLQTAQNICSKYQTSAYIKIFFYLFEFYFIFHILSYFCCRVATLPVTPNKEDKKNYFPQQRKDIFWQKDIFAVFISVIWYYRSVVLWKEFMQFILVFFL